MTGLSNRLDLLTFKLESLPSDVRQLRISPTVTIGETVYTAGNALGEGIALRSGVLSSQTPETLDGRWNYLRYSAPASTGNSGGPLLNSRAEVIGVVVMKSGDENLNYGVPIGLLKELSAERAEYVYKGLTESDLGLKLTDDRWNLSQPLPKALQELNTAAAHAYDEERVRLRKRFDEKFSAQIFPGDPALEPFVIEAQFSRGGGFLELDKDESGKWSASEPEGKVKSLNDQGSLWFNVARGTQSVQVDATYYFPKEKVVSDYFKDPKKLFDRILTELSWNRSFAGETVMIQLGAARLLRSTYAGNYAQWKSFLDLGEKWIPVPVAKAGIQLQLHGKSMAAALEARGQRFEFSHAADFNHELSLGYLWSPKSPGVLELANVQFAEQTDQSGGQHRYLLLHEPSSKGGQAYKDFWKRVTTRSALSMD